MGRNQANQKPPDKSNILLLRKNFEYPKNEWECESDENNTKFRENVPWGEKNHSIGKHLHAKGRGGGKGLGLHFAWVGKSELLWGTSGGGSHVFI